MATYSLTVTSELDKLESIARFVVQAAREMGMDEHSTYAVQLAVDEACTNIMEYAYQGRSGQPVTVECREEDGKCIVVIRDQGKPFDPSHIKAPNLISPLSSRKVGGWGMYLIHKLMDDVQYHFDCEKGNELTLVKSIQSPSPPSEEESL